MDLQSGDRAQDAGHPPPGRVRRNLLRRHLSHLLSRQTGKWHQWDPAKVSRVTHLAAPSAGEIEPRAGEPAAVEIDPRRLRTDFEDVERIRRDARERLASHPWIEVIYEDLCDDYTGVCAAVQRFLGLEPMDLEPATHKLETRPLARAVSNFVQLAEAFRDTRWSVFFDDQEGHSKITPSASSRRLASSS